MANNLDFFEIKEVTITAANQLVPFETKLSGTAKKVIGYLLSATTHDDTKSLATVGISFNGGRENTINEEVIVRNPATIRRRVVPLDQNQILLQNSYVMGYVEDHSVSATYPYTVKIYFHLSKHF